jgi:hypothetical protein
MTTAEINNAHRDDGEFKKMPSGDAQRTWFPEMVGRLRSNWHEGMSMPALISLRDELDEILQCIRASRNIRTPIITCRKCGMTAPAAPHHVSVRALILALGRFEITSKDEARALEKEWVAYRKHRRLTGEGKVVVEMPEICRH